MFFRSSGWTRWPRVADLRAYLVEHAIAGSVHTSREDNLRNIHRMLADTPEYWFGLHRRRAWSFDEVFDVMVRYCGIDPDPSHTQGVDTIDPDLTIAALERHRDRLALAAQRKERVILASGHPTGILAIHLELAAALRAAGCHVVVQEVDWSWPWEHEWGRSRPRQVRWLNGVAVMASGGDVLHTHQPEPMSAVLAALSVAPDLVVADHGWAGAAAEAGLETLAYADCNDPALFVAEAEGKPIVTVPLDDNVRPHLYAPVTAFLLAGWDPRVGA
jgi:hypothetical protein